MKWATTLLAFLLTLGVSAQDENHKFTVGPAKQEVRDVKGTLQLTMWLNTSFPENCCLQFSLSRFIHTYDYLKDKLTLDSARVPIAQEETVATVEKAKVKYVATIPYPGIFDLDVFLPNMQTDENVVAKVHPADYGRRFALLKIPAGTPKDITAHIQRAADELYSIHKRLMAMYHKMRAATVDSVVQDMETIKKELQAIRKLIEDPMAKVPVDKSRDSVLAGTYQCLKTVLLRFDSMAMQLKLYLELQKAGKVKAEGPGGGGDQNDNTGDPAHNNNNANDLPADIANGKLTFEELRKSLNRFRKVIVRESLSWCMIFLKAVVGEVEKEYDLAKTAETYDTDFNKLISESDPEISAISRAIDQALVYDETGSIGKLLDLDEKRKFQKEGLKAVRDFLLYARDDVQGNRKGEAPDNVKKARTQVDTDIADVQRRLSEGQ